MLTYRTGVAGSGRGARNMAEHLLQQTLSPEMAVMADYYEQGVAPPTAAEAVASRYVRHIVDRQLQSSAALDELVNVEAARLGESALGREGRAVEGDELRLRALAAFTAAGMIQREEALTSYARLTGQPSAGEVLADRLDAAIQAARSERDYSSATATPRRDMNPALANRLGIDPNRGLTPREVAFLLNGQRADGEDIPGKEKQSATVSLGELFGLDAARRPTRPELECLLAGQTIEGEPLAKDKAGRAVVVLGDFDVAAMVQQAVEDIGRFVRRRRDNFDVVGAMLVRDMGIEAEAGINAVAGIDIAARCPTLPAAEKLSI